MLEKLLLPENHAIAILIRDHDKVKDLFDRFKKAGAPAEKEKIIAEAVSELKVHAVIEEEIFYPAVRDAISARSTIPIAATAAAITTIAPQRTNVCWSSSARDAPPSSPRATTNKVARTR